MNTSITIVVDNTVRRSHGLLGEHGLSMFVSHGNRMFLFDTGQSGTALLNNARLLGIPLPRISDIILSHGHYDHTGGLKKLLEKHGNGKIHCHPDAFSQRFSLRNGPIGYVLSDITIPFPREVLLSCNAQFVETAAFGAISDGVYYSGQVERPVGWKPLDENLKIFDGQGFVPDPFHDDISLVVESNSGPILLLGCAHAGLEAIFSHMKEKGGWDEYHAVVGGTHLMAAKSERELSQAVNLLVSYNVKMVVPCHCTGPHATRYLQNAFGDSCIAGHVGLTLRF